MGQNYQLRKMTAEAGLALPTNYMRNNLDVNEEKEYQFDEPTGKTITTTTVVARKFDPAPPDPLLERKAALGLPNSRGSPLSKNFSPKSKANSPKYKAGGSPKSKAKK